MVTIHGFTRPETCALTGVTVDQLNYWDKLALVVPTRLGNSKRPPVLYSWNQLIQLCVIKNYKFDLDSDELKRILELVREAEDTLYLSCKSLLVFNNLSKQYERTKGTDKEVTLAFIDRNESIADLVKRVFGVELEKVSLFDLTVLPPMKKFVDDIVENAKNSSVINFDDFKARAKIDVA